MRCPMADPLSPMFFSRVTKWTLRCSDNNNTASQAAAVAGLAKCRDWEAWIAIRDSVDTLDLWLPNIATTPI